ncbi:hypothetical protein BH09VER1_BH09VER1_52150 [soil metagenome]
MSRLAQILFSLGLFCAGVQLVRAMDPEYQKALDETLRFCPPGDYGDRPVRGFISGRTQNYDLSKADLTADPPVPITFQQGLVMNQLIALPKGVDFFPSAVAELEKNYPQAFASGGLPACAQSLRKLNEKLLREGQVYLSDGRLYARRPAVMNVTRVLPASESRVTLRKGTPVLILEAEQDYQIMIGRMTFRLEAKDIVLQ